MYNKKTKYRLIKFLITIIIRKKIHIILLVLNYTILNYGILEVIKKMKENSRKREISKQINKEVIVTLVLYLIYFLWWYYFAYEFSTDNVEDYKYILGLPEWFFYSCVVGLVLINFLVFLAIKFFFKEIDLDVFEKNEETNQNNKENK